MDMQAIGFNERELVTIESAKDDYLLSISGKFGNYKAEKLGFKGTKAKLKVTGKNILIKTINQNGNLEVNNTEYMIPIFFEDGVYDLTLEGNIKYNVVQVEKKIELLKKSRKYSIREGKIKFTSDIGDTTFYIKDGNKEIAKITVEVFPTKINYKEDYFLLLKEVNDNMEALIFDLLDKTYLNAKLIDKAKTNNEFLSILRSIFNELEKSLIRITKSFKHNIETVEHIERVDKIKKVSNRTIGYLRSHQSILENHPKGFINYGDERYIPNKAINIKKRMTIDISENRYVKYAIKEIIMKLDNIESIIKRKNNNEIYLNLIQEKKKKLSNILRNKFNEIRSLDCSKEVNLAFQMAPGYKEFYKNYILLKKGLDFTSGIMEITPKKMYKLYEIWCYIKLHSMIKELGFVVKTLDIIKATNNGLTINLTQDKESRVIYEKENKIVELWYNKSYEGLPTTIQRPDVVLVVREERQKDKIYIFDAKYRVQVNNRKITVEEDDINIMHRYRDSIVAEIENRNQFEYKTFGAYVMFPCEKEEEFQNDKYYKSIEKVNIGAFPMLPNKNRLIYEHLDKILNETSIEANKRRVITNISIDNLEADEIKYREIETGKNKLIYIKK